MKRILAFVVLTAFSSFSYADYEDISDKFFAFIKAGETTAAIDYLYDSNPWVSKKSDQVVNVKTQLSQLDSLVGKYIFHEEIVKSEVGTRYVHIIYLVGYERQPVRYQLNFYDADGTWRFQGVSFDTRLTDDIKSQSNAKLLGGG